MTDQLGVHDMIPDALARSLAGHYAREPRDALACLYWTGQVTPRAIHVIDLNLRGDDFPPLKTVKGSRDAQALVAELRALKHYCKHNMGRGPVTDWHGPPPGNTPERQAWVQQSRLTIPWGWRPEEET